MLLVSFSLDEVSEAFRAVLPDYLDALSQLAYIHEERGQPGMTRAPCENRTMTRNNKLPDSAAPYETITLLRVSQLPLVIS